MIKEGIELEHDKPHILEGRMLATTLPISVLGTIGNLILLWLFCCRIQKTRLTLYFLNLTIANLIIIFCNVVVVITYFTRLYPSLIFQRVMQILHICGFDTNFYFITVIAVERYLTATSPAWYQHHRPKNLSVAMCIFLWGLSCVVSLVNYYGCNPRFDINLNTLLVNCKAANIIEIIIELIFFLPIMVCFTLAIWIRMHTRNQQTPLARIDVTIVALVLLFLIVNAPVRIANIIAAWVFKVDLFLLGKISLLMDSFHSASNPFVFIIVGFWKMPKSIKLTFMFLETALKDEGCMAEKTKADQEQA
ncbi:proto-oncogene Mas [Pogona vitticeps]|uniref:Proto-oncogene Mas-like n=1 Tax=Pogona vitticeps TaxID=103695 RepID=A0ABM5GJV4_9SAUR